MARAFLPKVATANDLFQGDVIYLTDEGTWTRSLSAAAVAITPDAAEELLADASQFPGEVVGPYLADVKIKDGVPVPDHFREAFRTRGPSNYFHGKQAEVV